MRVALLLVALASQGALAAPPEDAPLEDLGDRLRFGVSASLGGVVPLAMVYLEGEARFGYQVTTGFGAFVIGGAGVGFGSGSYLAFVGGTVEFLPADFFYVGGGPVFGYGRMSVFNFNNGPNDDERPLSVAEPATSGVGGTFKPGLDLRFGFASASGRPPGFRRLGFTFGFDAKLFFHTDLNFSWGQVGRAVTTTQSIVTITPMVVIGFDSR